MKKNLLSVIILALLVVNLVMTTVMMFSVTGTNKKTAAIVTDIASILDIQLNTSEDAGEVTSSTISMADTEAYDLEDEMTISLKKSEDGSDHYVKVSITLSLNTKDEGYATYGETIGDKVGIIKGIINETFSNYTYEEIKSDTNYNEIRQDLLTRLQEKFDSTFIFDVVFSNIVLQ